MLVSQCSFTFALVSAASALATRHIATTPGTVQDGQGHASRMNFRWPERAMSKRGIPVISLALKLQGLPAILVAQPLKNIRERILPRSQTFTRLHLGHVDHDLPAWQAGIDHVLDGIVAGWLSVPVEGVFPLAEAAGMHRRLEGRHVAGKLLLQAGA